MGHGKGHENLVLSKQEAQLAKEAAKLYGISEEDAATLILQGGIARRVKKRTGKTPAKVYDLRKRS
jgi:hypothetical protein